jgi:hypothetical protein
MNWYKKAQLDKEAGDFGKFFFGLSIPVIAILLGAQVSEVERKIQENPQELKQQIQQVQQVKEQPKAPILYKQTPTNNIKNYFENEYQTILNAAKRNNLNPEDYDLLFAIRKAENGKKGREFGILHPKCEEEMKKRPNETLDIQAGWAASTIKKNRERWEKEGEPGDFITYLGNRYAPRKATNDPNNLNKNWIKNVSKWEQKL